MSTHKGNARVEFFREWLRRFGVAPVNETDLAALPVREFIEAFGEPINTRIGHLLRWHISGRLVLIDGGLAYYLAQPFLTNRDKVNWWRLIDGGPADHLIRPPRKGGDGPMPPADGQGEKGNGYVKFRAFARVTVSQPCVD
ncbi:MAG: hypothetical protein M1457_08530 [bacterium]|nr:hypothetical protein [bacterium]